MKKLNKTEEKILDTAKYIYKKLGYTSSSFQMIVERSGISRSLINYYYPKKQDVLVTILGRHLDTMIEYVEAQKDYNAILVYMLSTALYTKSMFVTEETRRFHMDVILRTDRKVGPYKNYDKLYRDIVTQYNVDMSEDELYLKEIAIFGAKSELFANYEKGSIPYPLHEVHKMVMINTLTLLKIPYIVINENIKIFEEEYKELSKKEFLLFD